jgi:TatD DNase family protein
MAIDSHLHINNRQTEDIENTIDRINKDDNIERVINVGIDIESSEEAVSTTKGNKKIYAAVGIHPINIYHQNVEKLYSLATNSKVVAIGEIGFDFINPYYDWQKAFLKDQIKIANDLKLPVILHLNNKNEYLVDLFENEIAPEYGCAIHGLLLEESMIKYIIAKGYYIALDGTITYDIDSRNKKLICSIPNELLLVETDSPNLVPRGAEIAENEASNIKYIIHELANIKELSYSETENLTTANTRKLFRKLK